MPPLDLPFLLMGRWILSLVAVDEDGRKEGGVAEMVGRDSAPSSADAAQMASRRWCVARDEDRAGGAAVWDGGVGGNAVGGVHILL